MDSNRASYKALNEFINFNIAFEDGSDYNNTNNESCKSCNETIEVFDAEYMSLDQYASMQTGSCRYPYIACYMLVIKCGDCINTLRSTS